MKEHNHHFTCLNCHKEWSCYVKHLVKSRLRRFCCQVCLYESRRNYVELTCAGCSNRFFREEKYLNKTKSRSGLRFCTKECMENSVKSIKEIQPSHFYTSKNYENRILKDSKQICVGCGNGTKHQLHVHHIDGNNKNDEVSNLEVVCSICHTNRHLKQKDGMIYFCTTSLTDREFVKTLDKLEAENRVKSTPIDVSILGFELRSIKTSSRRLITKPKKPDGKPFANLEELEDLMSKFSLREIGKIFYVSHTTVKKTYNKLKQQIILD